MRPVVHHRREEAAVVAREVHPARARELVAELLAHVADGRRVDQRGELLHVLDESAVVQRLVAIVDVLKWRVSGRCVGVTREPSCGVAGAARLEMEVLPKRGLGPIALPREAFS